MLLKHLVDLDLESDKNLTLPDLGRTIASLNRSSVTVKKYQAEVRDRVTKAAESIEASVKKEGLSSETAALIRSQILGICSTP